MFRITINVLQEVISIVSLPFRKQDTANMVVYEKYDLAAYAAEITSRVEKINCAREWATNERTNERTKRLARGFSWELRPAPTEIVGARNSEQQDIKVQNSIKSMLYETR